jgi:chromosomal replication initiator protein
MATTAVAQFLATPENRSALAAIQDFLHALTVGDCDRLPSPLFLHGPSGTGKTHLLKTLTDELANTEVSVCSLSANDFADSVDFTEAQNAALLIVEDLQHLPTRFADPLIALMDRRLADQAPMIFTALQGPGRLTHRGTPMPRRLTNRLAAGLVVRLAPMQKASRRRLFETLSQAAKLSLAPDILDWLAENLIGGGRQLEGAVRQLKALQRLQAKPLHLDAIRAHFRTQIDATAPSVKRIAEHVSGYYQVPPKHVVSARRSHDVLLPRQISMYLARQLTRLSLEQIGKFFGGRDHKTVRHACKKVETAMKSDAVLSGAVRQMHAELL